MGLPYKIHQVSPEHRARFADAPWCLRFFDDPALAPITITAPRTATNNTLIYRTLATEDTVPAFQAFLCPPSPAFAYGQLIGVMALGSGVNGYDNTAHGGFLAVLLDEYIGTAVQGVKPDDKGSMTASLRVDYRRPMRTPGFFLCKTWVDNIDGRKYWGRGTLEDQDGHIVATGEGLFLMVDLAVTREKL